MSFSNRGAIYLKQEKYDLALADFNQAIKIDPNNADAYGNRGLIHYQQNKNNLAIADWQKAKQLFINQGDDNSVQQVNSLLERLP